MNSEGLKDAKKVHNKKVSSSLKVPKVTLIAAIDENGVLGKDNQLIWHLPEDLKRFKRLTTGHSIIMGRKTFESLPKALPNRHNIVVTRNQNYSKEEVTVCHSLEAAIGFTKDDDQPFIIGGGEIYKQAIGLADVIELTRIHSQFEGDVFFPKIDSKKWTVEKEERMSHPDFEYSFFTYIKK